MAYTTNITEDEHTQLVIIESGVLAAASKSKGKLQCRAEVQLIADQASLCSDKSGPHPKPHLLTLPAELQLKIFDELDNDPPTAACLGITCKKFYPLFRARHKKVLLRPTIYNDGSIEAWNYTADFHNENKRLHYKLLNDWMPQNLVFSSGYKVLKFVTHGRDLEIRQTWEEFEKQCTLEVAQFNNIMRLRRNRYLGEE
jgi:hypothetical protein